MSGGIHKKNFKKKCDKGINKPTKRGCLEQFGFCSEASSVKKIKKEEKPNSGSTSYEEKQAKTSTKQKSILTPLRKRIPAMKTRG